ncbi:DUF3298 and DUF4163 domain-containing protein [Gracilibacillus sp. S3-1-1]|uniref:DUF3298 and DUF4163 domain-containing protein n=1 Tax=Gracilibacillus pellucidus TaxID=3095368 RepID=A0ACC6M4K0_9BACI|nr:DUF3298 and DUF4163 domain-containing protein [Gracilibacillus sp. S3-1-1]MDX8045815.1 DUF3298 and DUF4163 domain-containing protein [Gracilibacillus sp. S3-1-1]
MKRTIVLFILCMMIAFPVFADNQAALVTDEIYKDIEALKYPYVSEIEKEKVADKINQTFEMYIEKAYLAYEENVQLGEKLDFPAEYMTDYQLKYNKNPYLSILTSNYIYSGGAHGNTFIESFNFNVKDGKRIYLTNILKEKEQIEVVRDHVWEYATERPDIFYPDLKKEDIHLTKDTAFYFTDEGITLVFQQYEIAPYVSGNQEIEVPSELYE